MCICFWKKKIKCKIKIKLHESLFVNLLNKFQQSRDSTMDYLTYKKYKYRNTLVKVFFFFFALVYFHGITAGSLMVFFCFIYFKILVNLYLVSSGWEVRFFFCVLLFLGLMICDKNAGIYLHKKLYTVRNKWEKI